MRGELTFTLPSSALNAGNLAGHMALENSSGWLPLCPATLHSDISRCSAKMEADYCSHFMNEETETEITVLVRSFLGHKSKNRAADPLARSRSLEQHIAWDGKMNGTGLGEPKVGTRCSI